MFLGLSSWVLEYKRGRDILWFRNVGCWVRYEDIFGVLLSLVQLKGKFYFFFNIFKVNSDLNLIKVVVKFKFRFRIDQMDLVFFIVFMLYIYISSLIEEGVSFFLGVSIIYYYIFIYKVDI